MSGIGNNNDAVPRHQELLPQVQTGGMDKAGQVKGGSIMDDEETLDALDQFVAQQCSGSGKLDPVQTRAMVAGGENVLKQIYQTDDGGKAMGLCTPENAVKVCWYITARMVEQGEEFTGGAFQILDPGGKLHAFLESCPGAYFRNSTHMKGYREAAGQENLPAVQHDTKKVAKERQATKQQGLDLRQMGLPGHNKNTILFGGLNTGHGEHRSTYLKLEEAGAHSPTIKNNLQKKGNLGEFGRHTATTVEAFAPGAKTTVGKAVMKQTVARVVGREEKVGPELEGRREDTPESVLKAKDAALHALKHMDMAKGMSKAAVKKHVDSAKKSCSDGLTQTIGFVDEVQRGVDDFLDKNRGRLKPKEVRSFQDDLYEIAQNRAEMEFAIAEARAAIHQERGLAEKVDIVGDEVVIDLENLA